MPRSACGYVWNNLWQSGCGSAHGRHGCDANGSSPVVQLICVTSLTLERGMSVHRTLQGLHQEERRLFRALLLQLRWGPHLVRLLSLSRPVVRGMSLAQGYDN